MIIQTVEYYKLILSIQKICTIITLHLLRKLKQKKLCYQIISKKKKVNTISQLAVSRNVYQICAVKTKYVLHCRYYSYIYS